MSLRVPALARPLLAEATFALPSEDDTDVASAKLMALRQTLLLIYCADLWSMPKINPEPAWAMTVLFFLGWLRPFVRYVDVAATLSLAVAVVQHFPFSANHLFLGLFCFLLLSLTDSRNGDELRRILAVLRFVPTLGFFYSGLHKLLYGFYFRGELLTFATCTQPKFRAFFTLLFPASDFKPLCDASQGAPMIYDSVLFILMSNATYLAEIFLPLLLLFARTRKLALAAILLLLAAIEAGAREFFFGGIMLSLLLLYTDTLNRRLLPLILAVYAYLLMANFGWVPMWNFT